MDIEVKSLTKRYPGGALALDKLDLHVPTGMFGLLGSNGAGKTTLMRILAGVLPPTGGSVKIGPYDLFDDEDKVEIQQRLGYLPQELGVYPELSAREFLDYIAILKGLDNPSRRRRRVEEVLDLVSLAKVASRRLGGYSGGMKRRVGIAQALLTDPALLIVDEPTAGLDPEERVRFRMLLA
ncbi:MAG: ATP-binding cassette domain-containing protein, partial [Acidimicrobiales bacterium]